MGLYITQRSGTAPHLLTFNTVLDASGEGVTLLMLTPSTDGRAHLPRRAPGEQQQLVLAVRQAVEKDVAPVVHEHDPGRRDPEPLVARLAELGIFGALAEPEHGGLGLSLATAAMIVEEVARLGRPRRLARRPARGEPRHRAPLAPRRRERLLPPMTRGERWTAPIIGASIGARQAGKDWVLTGSAPVVANAGRAKLFLVNTALEDGAEPAASRWKRRGRA